MIQQEPKAYYRTFVVRNGLLTEHTERTVVSLALPVAQKTPPRLSLQRKLAPKQKKLFPCPAYGCNSGFARQGDMRSHFVEKHPDQLEQFPMLTPPNIIVCALCDKRFSRNNSFARHNRIHHDIHDFPTAGEHDSIMVDQLNSGQEQLVDLPVDDKIVELCGLQVTRASPEPTNNLLIVRELTSSFGRFSSSNNSSPSGCLTNSSSPGFSATCSDTCSPGCLGISSIQSDTSFISSYPSLPSCGSAFAIWSSELPQFKLRQQLQQQQQQQEQLSHQEHPVHKMSIEFLIDSVL